MTYTYYSVNAEMLWHYVIYIYFFLLFFHILIVFIVFLIVGIFASVSLNALCNIADCLILT